MLRLVAQGATLRCSEGIAPATLVVSRPEYVVDGRSIANIRDHQPMSNIASFGMCRSLLNPTVQAATSAAMGTLTPMPCVPPSFSPWMPGARYITQEIGGVPVPALTNDSTCTCAYAGTVTIEDASSDLGVE